MGNFQFTTAIDPVAADLVKRFYAERIRLEAEHTLTSATLYEDYSFWCEEEHLRPLALPQFCRLFGLLGVAKARIRGRVRYLGVSFISSRYPECGRLSKDTVQTFCNEHLCLDPQASLISKMLYAEYVAWAEQKCQAAFSLPTLVQELEKLGIRKKRVAGRVRFLGIAFTE